MSWQVIRGYWSCLGVGPRVVGLGGLGARKADLLQRAWSKDGQLASEGKGQDLALEGGECKGHSPWGEGWSDSIPRGGE